MSFREVFQATAVEEQGKKRLKMHSPAYFATLINKLPAGKKVWVTVDDRAPRRSEQQHRLYFAYLTYIADETGNEVEDLHEYFKAKYLALPQSVLTLKGESKPMIKYASTTGLTKAQFSEYLRRIELETGVPIPDTEAYLYGAREEQIEIRNKVMAEYPEDYQGAPLI